MNKILLIFISFTLLNCNSSQKNKLTKSTKKSNFCWVSGKIGNRTFEYGAIYISVSINGINNLPFQFDLGANQTLVYENPLKNFPELHNKLEIIDGDANGMEIFKLDSLDLSFGGYSFQDYTSYGLVDYGSKINNNIKPCENEGHFGSIGADLFQNKILVIDFKNQNFKLLDKLDKSQQSQFEFVNTEVSNNFMIIPIKIDEKTYKFIYDSGSSIFPILTSSKIAEQIAEKEINDSLNISNFQNAVKVYSKSIKANPNFGKLDLGKNNIWYSKEDYYQFNEKDYDGVIGNIMFLDKVICIDFKNKKFGIR